MKITLPLTHVRSGSNSAVSKLKFLDSSVPPMTFSQAVPDAVYAIDRYDECAGEDDPNAAGLSVSG